MFRMFALICGIGFAPAVVAQTSDSCLAPKSGAGCSPLAETLTRGVLAKGEHAYFEMPTDRYAHGVLGDVIEWGRLTYLVQGSPAHGPYFMTHIDLPQTRVFEDVQPRFGDIDGDGQRDIVVVESDAQRGAQLAIYGLNADQELVKIAATPFIGTRFRWLAPVGIADFDGDGSLDVAYIDRPHLRKQLQVWTYDEGKLTELAHKDGLTNHRIGEDFISGGVRVCDGNARMITADASWSRVIETRFVGTKLVSRAVGPFKGKHSFKQALRCR